MYQGSTTRSVIHIKVQGLYISDSLLISVDKTRTVTYKCCLRKWRNRVIPGASSKCEPRNAPTQGKIWGILKAVEGLLFAHRSTHSDKSKIIWRHGASWNRAWLPGLNFYFYFEDNLWVRKRHWSLFFLKGQHNKSLLFCFLSSFLWFPCYQMGPSHTALEYWNCLGILKFQMKPVKWPGLQEMYSTILSLLATKRTVSPP